MRFDVITIFPEAFDSYLNTSILARAQAHGFIEINVYNLRDFTTDSHKTVDDKPYGGGAGMVMKVDVIAKALKHIVPRKSKSTRIILLSAQGKRLDQKKVETLANNYKRLVFICGRYEGIDARVEHLIDEEISIGDYVLTGGELPALVLIDSISRFVPGVVGKSESIIEESFAHGSGMLEYPQYTRPEVFSWQGKKHKVPKVLLSGDHKKIREWRQEQAMKVTEKKRPDLLNEKAKPKKQKAK
jgi:tRNA (guanine37-N1)-methyltransferase